MDKKSREKLAKQAHVCADPDWPFIRINFIHIDNSRSFFYHCTSRHTGSRLTGFKNSNVEINKDLSYALEIARNIKAKCYKIENIISYKMIL